MIHSPYDVSKVHRYYESRGIKPFTVDLVNHTITIAPEVGKPFDKCLKEALEQFPSKSWAKIDPFDYGTQLFCFKDEDGCVSSYKLSHDWEEGSSEQAIAYRIDQIKMDPSFQKIKVTIKCSFA